MARKLNWGIFATGRIANKFASDLRFVNDANLYAVASRDIMKGSAFKDKYGAQVAYGSYEELAADSSVDVVYIATPHTLHFENTLMCLEAGKHVLCEKPIGMNSKQLEQMVNKAKEKNLFLMEALWTRFIPSYLKFREIVNNGTIGVPKFIQSDFGFVALPNPEGRLVNKALGGGSLLDIGIYPIFLALDLFGAPDSIESKAVLNENFIDETCSTLFEYKEKEVIASLSSTIAANTPVESIVYGTKGNVKLNRCWHAPSSIVLTVVDDSKILNFEENCFGYKYEAMEVNKCIVEGKLESDLFPLHKSIELHKTLDFIRQQIGLKYEADQ